MRSHHAVRLSSVKLSEEVRIDRAAVSVHSASVKVERVRDKAFVACHDVCKVAERLCVVSACSDVNVYSAAVVGVAYRTFVSELPCNFLQVVNVRIGEDRGCKFRFLEVTALFATRKTLMRLC